MCTYSTGEGNIVEGKEIMDNLMKIHKDLQKNTLLQFQGIPVRVDPNLKDNQFYCMVSQEVYEELCKKSPNYASDVNFNWFNPHIPDVDTPAT